MKRMIDLMTGFKPYIFPNILILLGFITADFIWLKMLPQLGISFGSGDLTALMLSFVRVGLLLFWISLQFIFKNVHLNIPHFSVWSFLTINVLLLGLCIYGFCVEPFHLTASRFEIEVKGLDHPIRIVQLSDIHVERTTNRERALSSFVEKQNPDMIVITGDLISEDYVNHPYAIKGLRDLLSNLHAPMGIYAVNGNVEPPFYLDQLLEGTYVHVLHNQVVRFPEFGSNIALIGLDFNDWDKDKAELKSVMQQTGPEDFTVLLYHTPDLVYEASDLKINLYLAGHTHGGQIRLPVFGAIFTNSRYGKKFEMGLYHVDETTLFVSRGLGFTGGVAPRMRFLAPPEIVLIDLVPEK